MPGPDDEFPWIEWLILLSLLAGIVALMYLAEWSPGVGFL